MKRPTRVPVSIVVRMNNASNMMAKWYHKADSVLPPPPRTVVTPEKMCAMPTARDGAPPVRAIKVCSPIWAASACMYCGVTTKPA